MEGEGWEGRDINDVLNVFTKKCCILIVVEIFSTTNTAFRVSLNVFLSKLNDVFQ